MQASAFLTMGKVLGDLVRAIFHPALNYVSGTFKNSSGSAISAAYVLGQPVKKVGANWEPIVAGGEAATEGLLLSQDLMTLANNTVHGDKFLVLVRGPAVIDKDALPVNDVAGVALTQADLLLALESLGIFVQSEPTVTSTQTK